MKKVVLCILGVIFWIITAIPALWLLGVCLKAAIEGIYPIRNIRIS